jgi:PAS domain S-box-containing protein
MHDAIWLLDVPTMKYTYRSDSANEMTGYTAEESANLTIKDVFPPADVQKIAVIIETEFKKYYAGELQGFPVATFEAQQYHKDGSLM